MDVRKTTKGAPIIATIILLSPKLDAVPFVVVSKSAEPNLDTVKTARLKSIMIRTLSTGPSGLVLSNEKGSLKPNQDPRF